VANSRNFFWIAATWFLRNPIKRRCFTLRSADGKYSKSNAELNIEDPGTAVYDVRNVRIFRQTDRQTEGNTTAANRRQPRPCQVVSRNWRQTISRERPKKNYPSAFWACGWRPWNHTAGWTLELGCFEKYLNTLYIRFCSIYKRNLLPYLRCFWGGCHAVSSRFVREPDFSREIRYFRGFVNLPERGGCLGYGDDVVSIASSKLLYVGPG